MTGNEGAPPPDLVVFNKAVRADETPVPIAIKLSSFKLAEPSFDDSARTLVYTNLRGGKGCIVLNDSFEYVVRILRLKGLDVAVFHRQKKGDPEYVYPFAMRRDAIESVDVSRKNGVIYVNTQTSTYAVCDSFDEACLIWKGKNK